jgi:sirohydrochlorin ferrochelatase
MTESPAPANGPAERSAVLLIAHGSRRPEANADLVRLAGLLANDPEFDIIETSYLELATPDIASGGRRCVARGAKTVRMLPYFLSAGAHVVEDLESHRAELSAEFPQVRFELCPHLGLHPLMVEIVRQRLRETIPAS